MRAAFSLLCLLATALCLYNVYGDNTEVAKQAENAACGSTGCVRTLRAERTPIAQGFTFQSTLNPPATVEVRCQRSYLLVGDFDCAPASH